MTWLVLALVACGGGPPAFEPEPNPDEDSWPEQPDLDAAITAEMVRSHVPGLATCIVKELEIRWCGAYGFADIEAERSVTTTTPFMVASVSKLITATATMAAFDNGLFTLDDPVSELLDFELEHPNDPTPMTYRMLLSHVAGVKDNWSVLNRYYVDGDSPVALDDFLASYFDPTGENYSASRNFVTAGVTEKTIYANMGFALLGHLVSLGTGTSFPEWSQERIFDPLQMEPASWHLEGLDEDEVAIPYEWWINGYESVEHYGYPDYPDGALRTGAEQLGRFLNMAIGGGSVGEIRVLLPDTQSNMLEVQYPNLDDTQGLAWYSWTLDGDTLWGHNGGDLGVATEMGFREDGVGFVVLMNAEGTRGDTLENIERALFEAADSL